MFDRWKHLARAVAKTVMGTKRKQQLSRNLAAAEDDIDRFQEIFRDRDKLITEVAELNASNEKLEKERDDARFVATELLDVIEPAATYARRVLARIDTPPDPVVEPETIEEGDGTEGDLLCVHTAKCRDIGGCAHSNRHSRWNSCAEGCGDLDGPTCAPVPDEENPATQPGGLPERKGG